MQPQGHLPRRNIVQRLQSRMRAPTKVRMQQFEFNAGSTLQRRTRWSKSEVQNGCYWIVPPRCNKTTDHRRPRYRKNSKESINELKERMEYPNYATMRRTKIE